MHFFGKQAKKVKNKEQEVNSSVIRPAAAPLPHVGK